MHLKSISMKGFKSFPDRQKLDFAPGISVIVGPNGSGKSNITDAVLWALGEQSPQAVRGHNMQDVIFSGGHGAAGRRSAEVEVVIDNSDGKLETDFREVSILRRLDRSGQSEYRINGARCRLIDVIEVISDTGLGKEMHSVVSQGRVEQVIHSKPRDRRLLIEEAAGLGKHRKRRRRAQLKLERTSQNLSRALDVEREARLRLKPLKRQAEAADLHTKLRRQSLEHEGKLIADALRELRAELEAAQSAAAQATAERERIEKQLKESATSREAAERELAERGRRQEALVGAVYATRAAVERLKHARGRTADAAEALRDGIKRRRAWLDGVEEVAAPAAGVSAPASEALEFIAKAAADRDGERRRVARLQVDLDEIEERIERGVGLGDEAQAMAAAGVEIVANAIEVDAGYEAALAAALGERLRAGLAPDLAAGLAALDGAGGSGTVLIARRANDSATASDPPVAGATRLLERVRVKESVRAEVEGLLAQTWIVEDLTALPDDFAGIAVTTGGASFHTWANELRKPRPKSEDQRQRLLTDRNRREQLAKELAAARTRLDGLERQVAEAETAIAARRVAAEQQELRHRQLAGERQRIAERVAVDEALVPVSEKLVELVDAGLERIEAQHEALELDLRQDHESSEVQTARLRELAQSESNLQGQLATANVESTQREVRVAHAGEQERESSARLANVAEGLGVELGAADEPLTEEERTKIERSLERVERKRAELGPVNPLAAREYEEAVTHADQLKEQREDSERALEELEQLIRETDRQIREAFENTFEETAKYFEEMVAHLFPGGSGRLKLVAPERPKRVLGGVDPEQASGEGEAAPDAASEADSSEVDEAEPEPPGVEVELTPAGKSTRRLSLLSGGEKALTALAFMFAVFCARPCPFYIMDEVEAALDDHNIDRFLELLRRYSDRSQFIVVTHQKRTMDVAEVVYGVSMGNDGVTKVISRRLAGAPATPVAAQPPAGEAGDPPAASVEQAA